MKPFWVCVAVVILMAPAVYAADRKDNEQIERVLDAIHAKENTTAQEMITAHPELLNASRRITMPLRTDGYQPIHVAVESGNTVMVKWLLDHGVDVDTPAVVVTRRGEKRGAGDTPIGVAIKNQSLDMLKCLVAAKATVSNGDVHLALIDGNLECAKYLLEHGGTEDLFSAAALSDLERLKVVLGSHPDLAEKSWYGYTPLHVAAMRGRLDAVKLLLKAGANINIETQPILTESGRTPLCLALATNQTEVALFLIENGADVNVNPGSSALHRAIYGNDLNLVKVLLTHKARIEERDELGRTPLQEAVYHSLKSIALLLIENGADPNAKEEDIRLPNGSGEDPELTSLDIAVNNQDRAMCEIMIQHGGKLNKASREKLLEVLDKKD